MHKIKVLHFSTHDEDCGIGKYQEMFLDAMSVSEEVENAFFEVSPNQIRTMPDDDKQATYRRLAAELANYDILHVQHEFSFYPHDEFLLACKAAKQAGKKLIVTIHTSPTVAFTRAVLPGYNPRSILHYLRAKRKEAHFMSTFIEPLKLADLVLAHNDVTKTALVGLGVREASIAEITIPVPKVDSSLKLHEISDRLNRKEGDVIFATTGFLHKFKGIDHAIKSLAYLPENYKLAIVGGMHQDHDNKIYNDLCDLIRNMGMINRVYITGYVPDDNKLNALIRECDVCVYPYEKKYYSNVSSAALNNAFANHIPVIAYPTESFKQLNREKEYMTLTQAFSYYELARELERNDRTAAKELSIEFAKKYSYYEVSKRLVTIYSSLSKS